MIMTENCTSGADACDHYEGGIAALRLIHVNVYPCILHYVQSLAVPSDSVTRRRLATSFVCAILAWLMSSRVSGASLSMTAGPIGGLLWGGWVCCW